MKFVVIIIERKKKSTKKLNESTNKGSVVYKIPTAAQGKENQGKQKFINASETIMFPLISVPTCKRRSTI